MSSLFFCVLYIVLLPFARGTGTVVTCFSGIVVPLALNVVKVRIRSYKNYKVKMELVKCHFSSN